ncbi:MAG: hypothetical protein J5758_03780, partial [Abditibacteriota bacterium]|nr:hypothetical protein [Abditibacteriota bacterium]
MNVIQLTIFIENKAGRVLSLTESLAENHINLMSVCVADTSEYGLVRLIVDKPEAARECLKEKGFSVRRTEIIAVELQNVPGSLNKVIRAVADAGLSIEYMYSFFGERSGMCYAALKFDDIAAAEAALSRAGFNILTQ